MRVVYRLSRVATLLSSLWAVGAAEPASAQGAAADQPRPIAAVLADPVVQRSLERVAAGRTRTAAALAAIGAIVSPSGAERERALHVAERMRAAGLARVAVDTGASPNVLGVIPGRSGRAVVFIATLDDLATVAEHQRRAAGPPRVEGERVVGPGTNTSATTAAVLAAAEALVAAGARPEHDLVFAAVAQEETGLVGMRRLHDAYRGRAVAMVDVLGEGRSVTYGALGIHWWRVVATGPGGHSLGGGLPNVNQGIARAVDRVLEHARSAQDSATRTVVNVAMLQSGAVFNHKPDSGWFSLDVRSLDAARVDAVEARVRAILADVTRETGIALAMRPYQLTPGGQLPGAATSPPVVAAVAAARHLGWEPRLGNAGSSNMNVAVAAGTPAIGLGGERGGRRGHADEWADVPAMLNTARMVVLLAATLGAR